MTGQELDLTAAIEAGWQWAVCCSDCPCGSGETDERRTSEGKEAAQRLIEAALPHIREQLARQLEATGASIEQAQLAATGGLLAPLPSGVVAGYTQAARIVRGEP